MPKERAPLPIGQGLDWSQGRASCSDKDLCPQRIRFPGRRARNLFRPDPSIVTVGDSIIALWRVSVEPPSQFRHGYDLYIRRSSLSLHRKKRIDTESRLLKENVSNANKAQIMSHVSIDCSEARCCVKPLQPMRYQEKKSWWGPGFNVACFVARLEVIVLHNMTDSA